MSIESLGSYYSERGHSSENRLFDIEDPDVDWILEQAPDEFEDRIDFLVGMVELLEPKQRVILLLKLESEEFDAYTVAQKEHAKFLVQEFLTIDPYLTRAERIKMIAKFTQATPAYIVQADLRRQNPYYPTNWDDEFDIDERFQIGDGLPRMWDGKKINYDQALQLARFQNTWSFYRNYFYPSITRLDNPIELTPDALLNAFQQFCTTLDENMPGTDITLNDLLGVLNYLEYDREADNAESCRYHQQVRETTNLILAFEE